VTQVSWASDRGGSGTASGTTNWSASGIALQSGANVLTVSARDAAGNTGTATLTVTVQSITLTVSKVGSGRGIVTSTPAGISCGATCSGSYFSGTAVTLKATAASGSIFSGWSGGGCAGIGSCTVSVTAATTVTATFSKSRQHR
jgi:Divergent InlB B-repeat domain